MKIVHKKRLLFFTVRHNQIVAKDILRSLLPFTFNEIRVYTTLS